jgi:hypothetical protein
MSDLTFKELINKICGELPDGYQLIIECENGYGGGKLLLPDTDAELEIEYDDLDIDLQILDLLERAKSGNHSNY